MNKIKALLMNNSPSLAWGAQEWNLVLTSWFIIMLFKAHKNGIELSSLEFVLPIVAAFVLKVIFHKIKSNKNTNEQ